MPQVHMRAALAASEERASALDDRLTEAVDRLAAGESSAQEELNASHQQVHALEAQLEHIIDYGVPPARAPT